MDEDSASFLINEPSPFLILSLDGLQVRIKRFFQKGLCRNHNRRISDFNGPDFLEGKVGTPSFPDLGRNIKKIEYSFVAGVRILI
ncbi:hypothetical protein DLM78_20265 [Leptospira stimsonii]|uniref:Uncharacterized protein n=1 Tax=Leptospira stimsonii TaxID=2202203 RepID=A0A8B3CK06_9LEPT|nr:hypothetical protein DLM78_20265 [Leptospira stimsonii]